MRQTSRDIEHPSRAVRPRRARVSPCAAKIRRSPEFSSPGSHGRRGGSRTPSRARSSSARTDATAQPHPSLAGSGRPGSPTQPRATRRRTRTGQTANPKVHLGPPSPTTAAPSTGSEQVSELRTRRRPEQGKRAPMNGLRGRRVPGHRRVSRSFSDRLTQLVETWASAGAGESGRAGARTAVCIRAEPCLGECFRVLAV